MKIATMVAGCLLALSSAGCGGDDDTSKHDEGDGCTASDECAAGLTCVATSTAGQKCFGPMRLVGHVVGSDTGSTMGGGIAGARVIALDEQLLPVSDVAITDAEGSYTLVLPLVRNDDGSPTHASTTLRASADDYQTFPGGVRQALPIDGASATQQPDKSWTIQSALTEVFLIALPEAQQGRAHLAGRVDAGDASGGVLIVAEETTTAASFSDLSDGDGHFVLFNVPDGTYEVRGYKADLQLTPQTQTLAGADVDDLLLAEEQGSLTTLTGTLQIVNAPNFTATSVVLAVKSTFNQVLGRGDIPAGLRAPRDGAPNVTGDWSIAGIPDGTYVVLAAFENDGEVRDPDTSIGGTETVEITVGPSDRGTTVDGGSFKITDALTTVGPGAEAMEEVTTSTPVLTWGPDSGNVYYQIVVFDALGDVIWDTTQPHDGPSSSNQSITYAGPPLEPDMIYQFRVISRDTKTNIPKSTTEDLRGVFYFQ